MIRINLLPHREEKRRAQRRHFMGLAGFFALAALASAGFVWFVIDQYIAGQNQRNEFLKKENAHLDKQIEEIKKLKDDIANLLARKQIIETLQADRSQSVLLLDELVKQTPDGVYLRSLKQEGPRVNVTGYAQSNARVSTLMRNLQGSMVLESPQLVEIKAATVTNRRISDFNMNFSFKRAKQPEVAAAPSSAKAPLAPTSSIPKAAQPAAKQG